MTAAWSMPTSQEEVYRRANGRRRYNKKRRELAEERRRQIALLLSRNHDLGHGFQRRLARRFGVSEATICNDVKHILDMGKKCPVCGARCRRL
jgi:hypothetical protein